MRTLWFVVPAAGRHSLTRVCLRQLRRTCDELGPFGIDASAVVIADDENLETARDLGFATVVRNNWRVSRKFNDGIMFACDERYNDRPADYVVPCGSDDWVDHRLFHELPPQDTILAFRRASFVNECGTSLQRCQLNYDGGVGIRVLPRGLVGRGSKRWDPFRPADEDLPRGCDTSILINIAQTFPGERAKIEYGHVSDYQVVDWKTKDEQLNSFRDVVVRHRHLGPPEDPFDALRGVYPAEALMEMRNHYRHIAKVAA